MLQPAVHPAAVPKRAARAAVAKPTPRPTIPVLHVPVLNMFARRATLHVLHQWVPAEVTLRVEAITIGATVPTVPTTEVAHLREAPLQVPAAAQAAAIVAEAAAQVQAVAIAQAEVVEVQEAEAIAQAAEVVQEVVEEDKFQPKPRI